MAMMDTLGIEPRASRMLSGCDTTTPCAHTAEHADAGHSESWRRGAERGGGQRGRGSHVTGVELAAFSLCGWRQSPSAQNSFVDSARFRRGGGGGGAPGWEAPVRICFAYALQGAAGRHPCPRLGETCSMPPGICMPFGTTTSAVAHIESQQSGTDTAINAYAPPRPSRASPLAPTHLRPPRCRSSPRASAHRISLPDCRLESCQGRACDFAGPAARAHPHLWGTATRDGTRPHNLLLRGEAPYPLGHTGCMHGARRLAVRGTRWRRTASDRRAKACAGACASACAGACASASADACASACAKACASACPAEL